MRRRDLLAGAAGVAVVGGGATYALTDISLTDDDSEAFEHRFALPGIDAAGSDPDSITVPTAGQVNYVELFATTCGACQRMMPELRAASDEVGDSVQFISVTNEPIGHTIDVEGVAEWWDDHGGNWQLAHDDELDLTRAVNANGTPYTVVFDRENRLVYDGGGFKSETEILELIDDARD